MQAAPVHKRVSLEVIEYADGNRVFALNGKLIATYHAQVISCAGEQWVGKCRGWNYAIIGICGGRLFVRHHAGSLATEKEAKDALQIQKRFFIKRIKDEIERSVNDHEEKQKPDQTDRPAQPEKYPWAPEPSKLNHC